MLPAARWWTGIVGFPLEAKPYGKPQTRVGVLSFGGAMKLNLIFLLIDLTILVIYPFAFLGGKLRQIFKFKR